MSTKIFIIVFIYLLEFCGLTSSQSLFPDRNEKIQQLKSKKDIKVTEIEKGIYKLQYPNGKTLFKNTNDYKLPASAELKYSPTYDSTIIDLRTIDTTLYYQKYSFWQEVNVGISNTGVPVIGDINNNDKPEIYGRRKGYNDADFSNYIVVMEENNQSIFDSAYGYDSTVLVRSIYDIDKDGMKELHLLKIPDSSYKYLFYKKTSDTTFATELSFVFNPWQTPNSQENNNFFGDWDGDEFTDQILIRDCCPPSVYIYEYNPSENNFDSIYQFDFSSIDLFYAGFGIGDFDQDGKTEFFAGSVHGKVLSIENTGNNSYSPNWQGTVETYNAYLLAETNDIDKNGKPEIWVGGDAYYNNLPITRITIFENNGNDNYEIVGRIDLIGIFSFYASNIQAIDLNKDGKDEIMLCIDETVIILKFTGSVNHQTYEAYYIKQNDIALSGISSNYYGAAMYDVTGDNNEDIIIHLGEYIEGLGFKIMTFIYKSNLSTQVIEESAKLNNFQLCQNYPNPFNPATTINYQLPQTGYVTLKIYDILGKEVATLVNEQKNSGRYSVNFDASKLASGVYIYRIKVNDYVSSKKMLLLK